MTLADDQAATVLAIEIISFPDGSEVDAHRACIRSAAIQMEIFTQESSLCRKGSRLLRFLLNKEAMLVAEREQQRAAKRSRRGQQASRDNLRAVFDDGGSYISREPTFDQTEQYHHKPSATHHETLQSSVQGPSAPALPRQNPRPLPVNRPSSYPGQAPYDPATPSHSSSSVHSNRGPPSYSSTPAEFTTLNGGEWPFDFTVPLPPAPHMPYDALPLPPHYAPSPHQSLLYATPGMSGAPLMYQEYGHQGVPLLTPDPSSGSASPSVLGLSTADYAIGEWSSQVTGSEPYTNGSYY